MTAWRDYSEPEQRLFLSLMESCGIAFEYREADQRLGLETEYLAPDLLPGKDVVAAQLAGRWNDDEESWRLEYEYPFLHPGLMRALLCDVGQRSGEAGVYWKYGVWVYDTSTGAAPGSSSRWPTIAGVGLRSSCKAAGTTRWPRGCANGSRTATVCSGTRT